MKFSKRVLLVQVQINHLNIIFDFELFVFLGIQHTYQSFSFFF